MLYTSKSSIMNPKSNTLSLNFHVALLVLVLILILGSCHNGVQGRQLSKSVDSASLTSQAMKDLQGGAKENLKTLQSSFRRIPPSRSNPTQNK